VWICHSLLSAELDRAKSPAEPRLYVERSRANETYPRPAKVDAARSGQTDKASEGIQAERVAASREMK
jgi:hypothetical protein